MVEEIRGKGLGFFAVCAEPQSAVDQFMKDLNLDFTVSVFLLF